MASIGPDAGLHADFGSGLYEGSPLGIPFVRFLSGVPDDRWDNDDLRELQGPILGSDFEAVDCSSLIADPDSGQAA